MGISPYISMARQRYAEATTNDEVERRGDAAPTNEADLSQSSTPSLAHRSCNPRSLELLKWTPPGMAVRHQCAKLRHVWCFSESPNQKESDMNATIVAV